MFNNGIATQSELYKLRKSNEQLQRTIEKQLEQINKTIQESIKLMKG